MPYYFRCKSNPSAPILTLADAWEAKEMKNHVDYDQVDENGLPVVPEDDGADKTIPLQGRQRS